MSIADILTREEIERLGPAAPEDLADTGVSAAFLSDLALKHVSSLADPTTESVAEKLCLPRTLTEDLLRQLCREHLIEVRVQMAVGSTRYAMLERGWEHVARIQSKSGYLGPAPVSLQSYTRLQRLQAKPARPATMQAVREAFADLVLPESLLQTLGYVINSRRSLFLSGPPGTGKTAIAERINAGLWGPIWVPHAIEIDGHVVRIFDAHNHRMAPVETRSVQYDRRWVRIERPLIIVGGELTLENADLAWSDMLRYYEAPFQLKANGGTLVIDDFGRQRVAPKDLLNRWIIPLERRVDYLTLQTGKKIEVPFEALVVFSTNLNETDLVDEAFMRRMGYRARLELPVPDTYIEIFKRAAAARGIRIEGSALAHVLNRYMIERRPMRACEPRDLINRIEDICLFEGRPLEITPELIDIAWRNYFGVAHGFAAGAGRS